LEASRQYGSTASTENPLFYNLKSLNSMGSRDLTAQLETQKNPMRHSYGTPLLIFDLETEE